MSFFSEIKAVLGGLFLGVFCSCVWETSSTDYLPLDDSIYPYAQLPRLVVETADFQDIRNTEDYVDGSLQFYGADGPETETVVMSIRGRGNSSFTAPKFSYRIKLQEKASLLEMPKDKDWLLVPNYMDKSLLRNFITAKMAAGDSRSWTPRSQFVELYVNRVYQGVYQLSEKIEIAKSRLNLPEETYLMEIDHKYKDEDVVVFSKSSVPFRVHSPKNPSDEALKKVENRLNDFESFLAKGNYNFDSLEAWVDIDSYIRYYWIQELSKNVDGAFNTSVFFTWNGNGPIVMGPLWDFDIAFGAVNGSSPAGWLVRHKYWNADLFKNKKFGKKVREYWLSHRDDFAAVADSVTLYGQKMALAARNNFLRWPILSETSMLDFSLEDYGSYEEAVGSLQRWIRARIKWIDEQYR